MLVEKRDLKIRTRKHALAVIHLFSELPKRTETQVLGGGSCSDLGHRSEHIIGRPHGQKFRSFQQYIPYPLSLILLCLRRALPFIDIYFPAFGLR
jgi:hypothetical protein